MQFKTIVKAVGEGLSILMMLSLDLDPSIVNSPILKNFGVQTHHKKLKNTDFSYSQAYIVEHKRGPGDRYLAHHKRTTALFKLNPNPSKGIKLVPLIYHKKEPIITQIRYGKGNIIVMNSFILLEVSAELLSYLVNTSNRYKQERFQKLIDDLENDIPKIVNDLFNVYQEVPLHLVNSKLGIDNATFSDLDYFKPILEELIISKKLNVLIRDAVLVKKASSPENCGYVG